MTTSTTDAEAIARVIENAMQDAWNDICDDTGCHPLDLERRSGHLTFRPGHWSRAVGQHAATAILSYLASRRGAIANDDIADALERCDWSGAPIGNKAIIASAIERLRENVLFGQDAADHLALIDYISDKIGLPKDEELSRETFSAWLSASRREAQEPSSLYQAAEERICECGAVGSGEGHTDWCPWQDSEWRKWGDAFNSAVSSAGALMTDDQIKHMVDRFLMWRLPEHFNPDCGISFDPKYRSQHGPVGTNLLDATQATAMVRHMIDGLPIASRREAQEPVAWRVTYADGGTVYLHHKPTGDSGVYECTPLYTAPPSPAPAGEVERPTPNERFIPRMLLLDDLHAVCVGGRWDGWKFYRHPDGQWVSLERLKEESAALNGGRSDG